MVHTINGLKRERAKFRKICDHEKAKLLLQQDKTKRKSEAKVPLWFKLKNKIISGQYSFEREINSFLWNKDWFIRQPEDWIPDSHNEERQIVSLVKWVYCKYEVPKCLFELFLEPGLLNAYIYLDWFITIGQGYSFQKAASSCLSKKEAHFFLSCKLNLKIEQTFWWAKCQAAKCSEETTNYVITNFTDMKSIKSKIWSDFIPFIERFRKDIDFVHLSEVTDFVGVQPTSFSLSGRTIGSLIKLSNEWHNEQVKKRFSEANRSWEGLPIDNWSFEHKETLSIWTITQLLTDKELYREGQSMRHCVSSYTKNCTSGKSFIFSLKMNGERKATIEVDMFKNVRQVRGRLNDKMSGLPKNVIRKWALANTLKITKYSGI